MAGEIKSTVYFHLSLSTQNFVEIKERKCLVEQTLFVLLLASSFCQNMKLSDKHFSSLALLSPYQKNLTISLAFYWNTFDEALVNEKKTNQTCKNSKCIQVTWKAVWKFTFTLTSMLWWCPDRKRSCFFFSAFFFLFSKKEGFFECALFF